MSVGYLAAANTPPSPETPVVLLSAPVNATWAANHAAEWNTKGIDGFLLRGMLDICSGDIWARDGDPNTTGLDDAMLLEVRLAQQRLSGAGISDSFLYTTFPDDFRGFQNPDDADAFIAAFRRVATFCAGAELRGIAVDTLSTSLMYHPRWDGYATPDSADLDDGARNLGRRVFDAMAAAYPDGCLLVLYDGPKSAGPLWPALMAGLVEGARRARSTSMHLLTRATFDVVDPASMVSALKLEDDFLALHLDPESRRYWVQHGSVAPGLRPLIQPSEGGEIYAAYPDESFRVQLAAAKLCAPTYVWIESAGQTWWQVAPDEASSYAGLHQSGALVAQQTKPLPTYLLSLRAVTPLDDLRRVMALTTPLDTPTVLAGTDGAAAVVWPGQSLALNAQETPCRITDLATGSNVPIPDEGANRAIGGYKSPVLVEGLSVSGRLLPASLWLAYDDAALQRWDAAVPLSYGFTNHTSFVLQGVLDAFSPPRWPIATEHQAFSLAPTEGVNVTTTLRGGWRAGAGVALRCAVTLPGSTLRTRTWSISVPPRSIWEALFEAPPVSAPRWADVDADGTAELLVATAAGELACLSENGVLRWGRRSRPGYALGPLAGRGPAGWQVVASVDTAGGMHFLRGDGVAVGDTDLPEIPVHAPVLGDVHESPGDELLVVLPSGMLQVWRLDGVLLWERESGIPGAFVALAAGDGVSEPWIVCAGSEVAVFNGRGDEIGRVAMPAEAAGAPVIIDLDADGVRDMLIGTVSGTLVRIEGTDVTVTNLGVSQSPVYAVSVAPSGAILATDSVEVHALDAALAQQWSWPCPGASPPAAVWAGDTVSYLVGDSAAGRMVCLNRDGVVQWEDSAALWGPVTGAAVDVVGRRVRYAYGSGDRALRVREFRMEP